MSSSYINHHPHRHSQLSPRQQHVYLHPLPQFISANHDNNGGGNDSNMDYNEIRNRHDSSESNMNNRIIPFSEQNVTFIINPYLQLVSVSVIVAMKRLV